jgi:hypothetical protein
MKRMILACLTLLSGCAPAQLDLMLKDIQGCHRTYQGTTGSVGVMPSASFYIACDPVVAPNTVQSVTTTTVSPPTPPQK